MAWVATENFRLVDALLKHPSPGAALMIQKLGPAGARLLMRYQASEMNRAGFATWEIAQIFLGIFFFFFLLFGTREKKGFLIASLVPLAFVVVQRFWLTPEITSLGRTLDFAPQASRDQFWLLHGAYTLLELIKWVALAAFAARLLFHRGVPLEDIRKQLDLINEPDHRHVNG